MKILLVEDDETAAMVTQLILESFNCMVRTVVKASEAVEALQKESFDFLFIDIGLPDSDGLVLVREIRERGLCSPTPLIILTAHNNGGYRDKAKAAGADEYVVKPLTRERAEEILRAHRVL